MNAALNLWKDAHAKRLSQYCAVRVIGRVSAVRGILLECKIPSAKVGDLCEVSKADGSLLLAEIVGFTQECTLLSALGPPRRYSGRCANPPAGRGTPDRRR
ncbi:type III secretion cytoplasmic ATPase HrcN [Pseudomonas syringae pv. japonica str. M301072]|uniref:Type III secretion cytoplasmic ATPase HrcN n=1 Tax=Pseudomonas syringae pv. japonica str. M301072 TaxID=629262 RepID=F3FTA1_PSESX|nr:type III secretion cytoplasmic ATPase HrcN [Pseudomonas syringae pv. japonica str. M301072]